MKAAKYDLVINQGATFGITVTIKQKNGLPLDLTGYTGKGQIREALESPIVVADIEVDITNPRKNGQVLLKLSAEQTKRLNFIYGVYDVKLTTPRNEIMRVLQGKVIVDREVTQ